MSKLKINKTRGFTLLEVLIILGIIGIITVITVGVFSNFKNTESLDKTSGLVIEVLRQAKHSTIYSKNSNQFGVHFDTNSIVLYVGPVYLAGSSTNQTYSFNPDVSVYTTNINGGGNNILFNKITGDTNNSGTIVLRSGVASTTKVITVYKTGLIEQ